MRWTTSTSLSRRVAEARFAASRRALHSVSALSAAHRIDRTSRPVAPRSSIRFREEFFNGKAQAEIEVDGKTVALAEVPDGDRPAGLDGRHGRARPRPGRR